MPNIVEKTRESAREGEAEFRLLVPTTGFLHDYLMYTDIHEAPTSFHFWVGVSVVASVLQRRAWISKGIYDVFPNLYVVLVAPSGTCRKSRAIDIGLDMLLDFDWINLMADKTSPEALLAALMHGTSGIETDGEEKKKVKFNLDSTGTVQAGELSVFLNKSTYMIGMVSLLTHLYDCPRRFKYLTRNKKPILLENTCLNLLGATTPAWLAKDIPEAAFEGGFMSRIVLVVKYWRDRDRCFPEAPPLGQVRELKMALAKIHANVRGEIDLDPDARVFFENWYKKHSEEKPKDATLSGFMERKPDTSLKLALILAVSEERSTISVTDIKRALSVITWTQKRMVSAFADVELSAMGQVASKIEEYLRIVGEATSREILRKFGFKLPNGARSLDEIRVLLERSGRATITEIRTGRVGRPKILWQANTWKEEDRE